MRYALLFAAVCFLAAPAAAGRFLVAEENDLYTSDNDRDYTQGIRFSYNFESVGRLERAYDAVAGFTPLFEGKGGNRQVEWIALGQNIYTPQDKTRINPDPNDRPYAGWLYTGASLMEDHGGRSLDHAELLVGVVGPASLAKQSQIIVHNLEDVAKPHGWRYQLDNEPGVALSLERKWRLHQPVGALGVEAIPETGVTLGNVWTYGMAGVLLRFGKNLLADYGTPRIRPNLSGTGYFNPSAMKGDYAWNIYGGFQGRAVARNIFLDGNTFSDSRSVDKKILAGNAVAGLAITMKDGPQLDFAYIWCRQEFETSRGCSRYGGINVGWGF